METQALQQSFLQETGGLERVIQLTERLDFPGKTTTENLAQYVDSLQGTDQLFYDALYSAVREYAEGVKKQKEYLCQKYFCNSKIFMNLVYNTVFLPLRPLVALGNILERKTKNKDINTVGMVAGLAAELWVGGAVHEYINEPIGRVLQAWTILSLGTALAFALTYDQRSMVRTYERARGISEYHHDLARKLVKHFGLATEAGTTNK